METKALSCLLGAILIHLTLGTFYSVGNVVPYMVSYMRSNGSPNATTEHGTYIVALFLLGQAFMIIAGTKLEQMFDCRIACIIGCVVHTISTFMTIWAIDTSLMSVVLIYGLGSGLGCGPAYMASIIAAQKWFPQNKAFATGSVVAGFGFGGLIFTNLQTLYMNPNNESPDSSGYFSKSVYERVPMLFIYMGVIFAIMQAIGCVLMFPPARDPQERSSAAPVHNVTVIQEDALPQVQSVVGAFKHKIFYVTGLLMMCVAPGVTFVNSLGKRYGQSYINDDRFLATVVAIAAVANASGRLIWGLLMDNFSFSKCFSVKVALFSSLILTFPFEFVLSSKYLYVIWMLGLFFGFSGTFVLFPVFVEQVFGVKYQGMIYGVLYIGLAISSIVTSLFIQKSIGPSLAATTNPDQAVWTRFLPCIVIAGLYITSLVAYLTLIPVHRLETAIRRRAESDLQKLRTSIFNRQDLYPLNRPTLAEKTTGSGIRRENSLGSIVRFTETPNQQFKLLN